MFFNEKIPIIYLYRKEFHIIILMKGAKQLKSYTKPYISGIYQQLYIVRHSFGIGNNIRSHSLTYILISKIDEGHDIYVKKWLWYPIWLY